MPDKPLPSFLLFFLSFFNLSSFRFVLFVPSLVLFAIYSSCLFHLPVVSPFLQRTLAIYLHLSHGFVYHVDDHSVTPRESVNARQSIKNHQSHDLALSTQISPPLIFQIGTMHTSSMIVYMHSLISPAISQTLTLCTVEVAKCMRSVYVVLVSSGAGCYLLFSQNIRCHHRPRLRPQSLRLHIYPLSGIVLLRSLNDAISPLCCHLFLPRPLSTFEVLGLDNTLASSPPSLGGAGGSSDPLRPSYLVIMMTILDHDGNLACIQ